MIEISFNVEIRVIEFSLVNDGLIPKVNKNNIHKWVKNSNPVSLVQFLVVGYLEMTEIDRFSHPVFASLNKAVWKRILIETLPW